jgi:hypothetical protein
MSEHTNVLFDDLHEPEVNIDRLKLIEFSEQVRRLVQVIREAIPSLRDLTGLFGSARRIWPPTCNDAIKILTGTGEYSHRLEALIDHSMRLPLSVVPLRLSLLLALRNLDAQIILLKQHLIRMREASKTQLNQPAEQRCEIEHELTLLLRYSEEVVYQAEHLLDRARFKERAYSMGKSQSSRDERSSRREE